MPVSFNTAAFRARVQAATMRGVVKATEAVREEAISLILNSPKSGRVYQRRGVMHQASAPGEPPASDTGKLVNSITATYDPTTLSGSITTVAYGLFLEFGTKNIEPRPFLRPALENMRENTQQVIAEEIRKEMAK